jgi:hypothetical protein
MKKKLFVLALLSVVFVTFINRVEASEIVSKDNTEGKYLMADISSTRQSNSKSKCRDGSYSSSKGRGACSRHGGVSYYL